MLVPTLTTRSTPTARARSRTSPASSNASRWAWVSIIREAAARASRRRGRRVDPREERSRRLDPLDLHGEPGRHAGPGEIGRLMQAREDPLGRLRDERRERDGDGPQPVGELVQDPVELLAARVVLRKLPGRRLLDVAIQAAHELPHSVERAGEIEFVEARRDLRPDLLDLG